MTRYNLMMAKKLIETKSVINYDDQMKRVKKVSTTLYFEHGQPLQILIPLLFYSKSN